MRVLKCLLERAPSAVSPEELIQAGWPGQPVSNSTLRQTILSLRETLDDHGPDFRLIATRHGVGYQFIGPVTRPAAPQSLKQPQWGRQVPIFIAIVLATLAMLLGVPQFTATGPRSTPLSEDSSVDAQRYRQAQDLLERREIEATLEYLGTISTDSEGPDELALPLAQALAAQGNYPAARAALTEVASQAERWPRQLRLEWEALSARLAFEFDPAVDHYQALNQYHPDRRITRAWIQALIDARRLEDAEQALEALERTYPDDPRNALLTGRLANAANDQDRRLKAAQRAVDLADQHELPALEQLALIAAAEAEIKLGQFESARLTLDRLDAMSNLPKRVQADQRLTRAEMLFQEGNYPAALAALEAAESLYEPLNAGDGLALALITRGNIHEMSGQADQAMEEIATAIELLDEVGDPRLLARAHINLGISQMRAGQTESALDNLELAQGYFRRSNNAQGEAIALLNTGTLMARAGRRRDAEPVFERALQAFETAADERGQAIALSNLAGLASAQRDSERSIELNRRALVIFEAMQARPDMARVALNLGLAHRRRGDLAIAENYMRQASQDFGELGIVPSQARSLINLGRLLLDMGQPDEARRIVASLRELDLQSPTEQSAIDRLESNLAQHDGRLDRADELLRAARARHGDDSDSPHRLLVDLERVELQLAQGDTIGAEREARRLADRFADLDYPNERVQALMLFTEALLAQGRSDEVHDWLQQAELILSEAPDAKQHLQLTMLASRLEPPTERRGQLELTQELASRQGFLDLKAKAQEEIASLEP